MVTFKGSSRRAGLFKHIRITVKYIVALTLDVQRMCWKD